MRHWTYAIAMVTVVASVGGTRSASAENRALLVGINDYQHPQVPDLKGCENDARAIGTLLERHYGFKPHQVRLLMSHEATRANIMTALNQWLVAGTRPGDTVVFMYSGHGTQAKDRNGDEDDGLDEVLCPVDYDPKTQQGGILDDELKTVFERLRGRRVTVLIDSCHSGTITKNIPWHEHSERTDAVPTDTWKSKFIVPPEGTYRDLPRTKAVFNKGVSVDDPEMDHVLYSACQPNQTAADANFIQSGQRVRHGAFTFFFLKGLAGNAADRDGDGKITNKEAIDYTEAKLRESQHDFSQTPEVRARGILLEQPVFAGDSGGGTGTGTAQDPGADVPRIVNLAGTQATINRGGVHGVTIGSVFEAFRGQGAARQVVGDLTITRVEQFQSEGAGATLAGQALPLYVRQKAYRPEDQPPVDTGQPSATGAGLNVYLAMFRGPQGRWVMPPPALVQVLRAEPRFAQVSKMGQADWNVQGTWAGGAIELAVANRNGIVAGRYRGASEAEAATFLRKKLVRAYVLKQLAALDNPNPSFRVNLDLAGGHRDFGMGDRIQFVFSSQRAGFLTLLNVDSNGQITVLFPNQWQPGRQVQAARAYQFPPPQARFTFYAKPPAGADGVWAIATLKPVRLGRLDDAARLRHGAVPADEAMAAADEIIQGLRGLAGSTSLGLRDLPTDGWSALSVTVRTMEINR